MRKYQQGFWKPLHPEKYQGDVNQIVFRSSWERKFLHWCDMNPSVLKYTSEELVIPYFSRMDQKMRRYFVDFVVQYQHKSGVVKTMIIEVKPHDQIKEPKRGRKREKTYLNERYQWEVNQDKWAAAREYAKKNQMEFVILDEYDLGIKKRKT